MVVAQLGMTAQSCRELVEQLMPSLAASDLVLSSEQVARLTDASPWVRDEHTP